VEVVVFRIPGVRGTPGQTIALMPTLNGGHTMNSTFIQKQTRKGFTLVELAVVVVIIGVLAAFGVPRLLKSIERSKASEAFAYLQSIRSGLERYQARTGTYSTVITDLDVQLPPPKYFTVGTIAAGSTGNIEDSWTLTLTRTGAAAGYGAYTVTFTDQGFSAAASTIVVDINPQG
jgi:prepilin-type N-terminal cleavage/methylation domain-containing protein